MFYMYLCHRKCGLPPAGADISQRLIYAFYSDYFLSLRPLDVEFMRRLSKVVNIVPVIAKADTLTLEERDFFKKKVVFFLMSFLKCVIRVVIPETSSDVLLCASLFVVS